MYKAKLNNINNKYNNMKRLKTQKKRTNCAAIYGLQQLQIIYNIDVAQYLEGKAKANLQKLKTMVYL